MVQTPLAGETFLSGGGGGIDIKLHLPWL